MGAGVALGCGVLVGTGVFVAGGTGVEVGNGISVGVAVPLPPFGTNKPGMQLAAPLVDKLSECGCHKPLPSSTQAPLYICCPTEQSGVN